MVRKKSRTVRRDRPTREPGQRREVKYYGVAACLTLWQRRPDDLIRIYVHESRVTECAALLKWAAAQRKAYHIVSNDDLERLTESVHHQGLCVLAQEAPVLSVRKFQQQLSQNVGPLALVYLDGVENPHNLGAILRTCAHFGMPYLLGCEGRLPRLSPSACRVAEGGAEYVSLVYEKEPGQVLRELADAGFTIIGTSVATLAASGESTVSEPDVAARVISKHTGSKAGADVALYAYDFPERCVLIMGAEVSGMTLGRKRQAHALVHIPGTGVMESLNVAAAFAVIAGEIFRQRQCAQA